MSHTFEMYVPGDKQDILDRITEAARNNGVEFSGNTSRGRFSGRISGSYTVFGNNVTVTLTKVPFGAFSIAERRLRDELEG